MELLYADDLNLIAEKKGITVGKLRKWKKVKEMLGLGVNGGKTKVMRCCSRVRANWKLQFFLKGSLS